MSQDLWLRCVSITRCMKEIEICELDLKSGKCADPLMPLLGQMDWLEELHYQLYQ